MTISSGKKLLAAIDSYLADCSARDQNSKKQCFPNVAGFCRFAGITVSKFLGFRQKFPSEFGVAGAYFEDAALNSGATASLVSFYLKQYGFWGEPLGGADSPGAAVECEHDLFADGV